MFQTEMILGGVRLYYELRTEKTMRWFRWHMVPSEAAPENVIRLSEELLDERRPDFAAGVPESYMEYRTLVEPTGRYLLEHGLCIIHAVAFLWQERAWLLTAPSGTGKTTQYQNWKKLWPDEVDMVCGDMPVLRKDSEGLIYACPSPWNGKEQLGFRNHKSYPVGGIVFLEQATHNKIAYADIHKLILPLWAQLIGCPETEKQASMMGYFADHLFNSCPVWKFENKGDEDSTRLMRATFELALERY